MKKTDQQHHSDHSPRRDFLKLAGGTAAASALVGMAVPNCHAGEAAPIKLALVGCGGRGTGAVGNAFSTTGGPVKLHAMADLFQHRLDRSFAGLNGRYKDKVDVPRERQFIGFDAYKKVIDSLDPGDVVLLTTHAAFRPLHFEYAVSKGVNVFAEKSFAVDAPNARRWLKVAKESEKKNLKVGVGFMWRHCKARQEAIGRIHDGQIGDVQSLRIYRVHGPVNCPPLPAGAHELKFQLQHPNSFTWVSSGVFVDWHCHNVDIACWAKDAWPVTAQGFAGRTHPEAAGQMDHYTIEYTFPDGTKLYAFSRYMPGCWNTYSDYAHGTKGSAILMTNLSQPKPRIYKNQNMTRENVTWEYGPKAPNPYITEWQVLLDAIRQDKPHNEATRAGEADIVALMGRTASHTGQMVTWEEASNSKFQFVDDIDNISFDTKAPVQADSKGLYAAPIPGRTVEG